jgi:hypothetical protein
VRRIVSLVGVVLVAIACAAAPASAVVVVPPITGSINCGVDGMMKFSPPLPDGNSNGAPRNLHVKVTATLSHCDNSGANGGKLRPTGGTLQMSGILEAGASCNDIADGTPADFTWDPNVFQVKWTGTPPTGTSHPTVGKSKTDVFSAWAPLIGVWEYDTDAFGPNDAFANDSATVDLVISGASQAAIRNCAQSKINPTNNKPFTLAGVSFSSADGSSISVAP